MDVEVNGLAACLCPWYIVLSRTIVRLLTRKALIMTDTTVATRRYVRGTLLPTYSNGQPQLDSEGQPMRLPGVRYLDENGEFTGRGDWEQTRSAIDELCARLDAGELPSTYGIPEPWGWEPDVPVSDATDSILAAEFPGSRSDAAQAKLRELVHERNQLRRDLVNRETAHSAERDRLSRQLEYARAEITDVADERLRPIWDQAAEAATREGFCPEYDRLCASLGIPGRARLYRGVVNVTLNLYAYAESRDPGVAEIEMMERVRDRLAALETEDRHEEHENGSISHVDVESIDAENVTVFQ